MDNKTPSPEKETKIDEKNDQNASEIVTETKHGSNKVLIIALAVMGALLILGVVGAVLVGTLFKNAGEIIVESATNSSITTDKDGNTTIETQDGTFSASTEQKLPTDFPNSIPLLENQKITSSYKSKNDSGNYWQITAETDENVDSVATTLKSSYMDWEIVSDTESNGSYILSYKNNDYEVNLIASKSSMDDNKTSVTYTVYQTALAE